MWQSEFRTVYFTFYIIGFCIFYWQLVYLSISIFWHKYLFIEIKDFPSLINNKLKLCQSLYSAKLVNHLIDHPRPTNFTMKNRFFFSEFVSRLDHVFSYSHFFFKQILANVAYIKYVFRYKIKNWLWLVN